MNTLSNTPHAPAPSFPSTDVYDPDDVGGHSPMLQPIRPKLEPSPSPPPMLPVPELHSEKGPLRERQRPSMGDGVLVHFMGSGRYQEISRMVATEPLASPEETEQICRGTGVAVPPNEEHWNRMKRSRSPPAINQDARGPGDVNDGKVLGQKAKESEDLAALAAQALSRSKEKTPPYTIVEADIGLESALLKARTASGEPMEDVKLSIPSRVVDTTQPRPRLDIPTRTDIHGAQAGALPPMQQLPSPVTGNNTVTLPSISESLGNLKNLPDTPRDKAAFSQSPPKAPPPLFSASPGKGSPPRSPVDLRALPSPGRNFFFQQRRRPSIAESQTYATSVEYSSSNAETPSDQSTPSTALGLDRMSIEGLTNPPIGGYQCNYDGCTAAPFQTQYLLNSHANVHSQNRPHYCSVKGCPRSETGKGFKRKNEMIRHGLVHDSPGYVCPFCPDREHKYPRPDNLQRHVRVHHVDKDKDDPLLRDVLAQRPVGPNRGRRRRGGTG